MAYGPYSRATSVDSEDEMDVYKDGEMRKTKLSVLKDYYTDSGSPDLSSVDWTEYQEDIFDLSGDSYWDDLKVPVTSINPSGQANPPNIDQNLAGTFLFASNTTEVIGFVVQIPHNYLEGSDLNAHVHWAKTSSASGDVYWELQYRWAKIGEVFDGTWSTIGSATVIEDTPDTDTADKHLITELGTIDGTGAGLSDMLICQLNRDHDNAGDTYAADARLLEFDFHYQIDGFGSPEEYEK
jgi:hypothetical protein